MSECTYILVVASFRRSVCNSIKMKFMYSTGRWNRTQSNVVNWHAQDTIAATIYIYMLVVINT